MRDRTLRHMYPSEGEIRCISLKLSEPRQLFSLLDPAPFRERELDSNAAQYLLDAATELHDEKQIKIVLNFRVMPEETIQRDMIKAIHHYFHYRAIKFKQQRRHLLRTGRLALLVGLLFMAFCSMIAWSLEGSENIGLKLTREGVIILGWVAMWKPIDVFLYEWWPILQDEKRCKRLQHMTVEIRPRNSLS